MSAFPMIKLASRLTACLALLFFFSSCASYFRKATPPYLQTLASYNLDPSTYQRIANKRVLSYQDLLELVRKGVPGDRIVPYLRATRANYSMSQAQIRQLVAAGADSVLINYLGRHSGMFLIDAGNEEKQQKLVNDYHFWRRAYFTDPGYMGSPPFNFLWPMEWYY
jgi:hypothetical protein